jgi:hypothetical protein
MKAILEMTDLESYKSIQHVAYLLLPLVRARSFLTGHPNKFKVRTMQSAALLHFIVTDGRSVSLSIALLIAVSDTPSWVTSRQSAQRGVVEIFFWLIQHVDGLIYCQGIWYTYSFLRKSHVTQSKQLFEFVMLI